MKLEEVKITQLETDNKEEFVATAIIRFTTMVSAVAWVASLAHHNGDSSAVHVAPTPTPAPVPVAARGGRRAAAVAPEAPPPAPVTTAVIPPVAVPAAAPAPVAASAAPLPAQQPVAAASPAAPATSAVSPVPASVPAAPLTSGAVPAELVAATSFRSVMIWMLANGFTTKEAIVAKCDELRKVMVQDPASGKEVAAVQAIARLPADLSDRVARALEVLTAEQGTAAPAT